MHVKRGCSLVIATNVVDTTNFSCNAQHATNTDDELPSD